MAANYNPTVLAFTHGVLQREALVPAGFPWAGSVGPNHPHIAQMAV